MHYNQALQKEESGINHFNKGLVLSKLDQLKMANKSLTTAKEKFITEKANVVNVYYCRYNLGINLRKLGEYDASIIELKEAAVVCPDKASVFNNLGLTYFENNEMDLAVQEFKKAVIKEPQSVHYNNRGLAYFHNDQITDALEDFDQAVLLNTIGDPTIYFNRGNAYLS